MEGLLNVSSTRRISDRQDHLTPATRPDTTKVVEDASEVNLNAPQDVLHALQSKPSFDVLRSCLDWLHEPHGFNIRIPGPQATQLISVLVNEIISNFWPLLKADRQHARELKFLVSSLSSVAGIGALCVRLRLLLDAGKVGKISKDAKAKLQGDLRDALEVLHLNLRGKNILRTLWQGIEEGVSKVLQRQLLIKELIQQISSGKVLSICAEALEYCELSRAEKDDRSWLGDGKIYSSWLGENARQLFKRFDTDSADNQKLVASVVTKGLSLGNADQVVEAVFPGILQGKEKAIASDLSFLNCFNVLEKRRLLSIILRLMSKRLITAPASSHEQLISCITYVTTKIIQHDPSLLDFSVEWLDGTLLEGVGAEIGVRRAMITATYTSEKNRGSTILDEDQKTITTHGEQLLKKLLKRFGDELSIQRSPMSSQEVCTQNLLVAVGYVYRLDRAYIVELAKSSSHLNAVSSRIAASSDRAQFLGMVYGMAISELVDPPDKRMTFGVEATDTPEASWYRSLVHVNDSIGTTRDLHSNPQATMPAPTPKTIKKGKQEPTPKGKSRIIEVVDASDEASDGSESSEDDLPVYSKPDSDQEDEDEDPTLIQRNKPTPPVYIRDLISGLRDVENYDRHKLALSTAASLIRRKSNFGSEVTEHIEDLASQITGLKDQYDLEKFQEMRIQAMVALVVAQPVKMGQWFSGMLFNGDYSMSQRASMLTTLTLAARELAGYRQEDAELTGAYVANKQLFASKKLPDKYDRIYRLEAAPVNALSQQLERTMLKPMAAEAADKMAGPKVLQVRTFSSRMEVEKKRKRPITNELAKVVADGFFYPLTNRWRANIQVYGDNSIFKTPFLQAHFLKTLALILSASGVNTLSLPAMTVEFWALLLSVRTAALSAKPVLEALLFSFLTILDLNGNDQRRIAEDHSRELLDTQHWIQQVLEHPGSGAQEDEKIRLLAAGVLVRAQEIVDKYQQLLMGDLLNFR